MHYLGCPARTNPAYATCTCREISQREHTAALQTFNDNAPQLEERLLSLESRIGQLEDLLSKVLNK